jgi:hypothetical protein
MLGIPYLRADQVTNEVKFGHKVHNRYYGTLKLCVVN